MGMGDGVNIGIVMSGIGLIMRQQAKEERQDFEEYLGLAQMLSPRWTALTQAFFARLLNLDAPCIRVSG